MEGLGWILTIVIGGLAGWIAEKIMKADHNLLTNVLLGIAGALVLNFILVALLGLTFAGLFGQLVIAVAGACGLIFLWRAIRS